MRSILEQAIVHQLNGEGDKAQELFHQFVVARARQIHESMRNGEDPLAEGWDDGVNADTYFNEEDLASLEDTDVDAPEADFADTDELAPEVDDLGGEGDVDELEDDLEAHEADDQELADEVDELSAKLAELEAKFAELTGDEDSDEDFGDEDFADEPVEDDMGDAFAGEDEDDFEHIGESIVDELEKIDGDCGEDGKEIGAGGKFQQQRRTALPQKKIGERQGGSPLELKTSTHTGFDREAAPSVADMKKRRNTMKKGGDNQESVKGGAEKGNGKELNGKSVTKNTKSPLSAVANKS